MRYASNSKKATRYSRLNRDATDKSKGKERKENSPIVLKINNSTNQKINKFKIGDTMEVVLTWPKTLNNVSNAGVAIVKNSGEFMFGANTLSENIKLDSKVNYFVDLNLSPGKYYLMAGLFGKTRYDVIEFLDRGPDFMIEKHDHDNSDGLVRLKHGWKK
jgi:hypothetical protein